MIEVGPYVLKAPFDKQKLSMTLGAAGDRRGQLDQLGREDHHDRVRRGQTISGGDRADVLDITTLSGGLQFIHVVVFWFADDCARVDESWGNVPANVIYAIYKPLCHQFGFRSFFLFGEQPYYPLKEAGMPGRSLPSIRSPDFRICVIL